MAKAKVSAKKKVPTKKATTKKAEVKQEEFDVKKMITDQVIESLESNNSLWKQGWKPVMPVNAKTKKRYNGINNLLLSLKAMNKGYTSPYWLTYKQIDELGGYLLPAGKVEHTFATGKKVMIDGKQQSTSICFYSPFKTTDKQTGEDKTIPLLKYYNVFNLSQTNLMNHPKFIDNEQEIYTVKDVDDMIDNYGILIENKLQDSACYYPTLDRIKMPTKKQFNTTQDYYASLLHEVVHSTGHESRLKRDLKGFKTDKDSYALEELTAEIGSMFLTNYYGIESEVLRTNNVSYIKSWLKHLKNDKTFIFKASKDAGKSFDYLVKDVEVIEESEEKQLQESK